MSLLDDLVARSRSPGRFVERRAFTLSRDKAIEKQRTFALRDPEQHVLELVQAAVFAGATYLAIDTRPSELLFAWVGGRPIVAREMEHLFDYLFADRTDPRWRHLAQLAVGVNAILGRRPRALRLESGDGSNAIRVDLDADGGATMGTPAAPIHGTYLLADYGRGWLSPFRPSSAHAERALVARRCLYAPIPILLNGEAPFGHHGARHLEIFGARVQEAFEDGRRRGVVALRSNVRAPTGFRIVVGGVWVTTLPLTGVADRALAGVVCDDHLRRTADHSDIVEDERYLAMLHAVQPVATELLRRALGPRYVPPLLPPLPTAEPPAPMVGEGTAAPEPVPDTIPTVWPRASETLTSLKLGTDAPLFWVDEEHRSSIAGRELEPDRFPWRVLVISPGQAVMLARLLPGATLHPLMSRADVAFVRRATERLVHFREVEANGGNFRVTLRLHLAGPLPAWGGGRDGVPYCVVGPEGTLETGVIDGREVRVTSLRDTVTPGDRKLDETFVAPRTSLLVHLDGPGTLEERHLALALAQAHALVGAAREEVERTLLAALLGAVAAPAFVATDGRVDVAVSLPGGWPEHLCGLPLVATTEGALSLRDLVDLLGTPAVRRVASMVELARMDALEARFGFGHLWHPSLDGGPVFAAGLFGARWIWFHVPSVWTMEEVSAVVWVAPALLSDSLPPTAVTHDGQWRVLPAPSPGILRASRGPDDGTVDWAEGYRTLSDGLARVEAEGKWSPWARGACTVGRAEGRCRLARLQLASVLQDTDTPMLASTDHGGRYTLAEVRTQPTVLAVARSGVRLAEPSTVAVTRDELEAIAAGGAGVALRYSDRPESLSVVSSAVHRWLLREPVRGDSGLRGWLGLRFPFDPRPSILLRTTGELVALSDAERSVPCQGLLWTADGPRAISLEQRRSAQLAGLRLYQELARLLGERSFPGDGEDRSAALAYARAFVHRARNRTGGHLVGTAKVLADLLLADDPTEPGWGTLPVDRTEPSAGGSEEPRHDVRARLADALGEPPLTIALLPVEEGHSLAPVSIDPLRSSESRATVLLDLSHPLVRAGLGSAGRAREVLLLELARQVCAWGIAAGFDLDLLRSQHVLLGQRLG